MTRADLIEVVRETLARAGFT
ncbi:MAG: hypothetical protein QOI63_1843, partial [Thermoplasmata archaeon]|nr:hypothetical protein [Thermoplasmata archaeon]